VSSGNPNRQMFAQFAVVARALGHEHRLELIEHLGQGEWPVEHLSARTGLAFANVSQHLQQLRRGGLVTSRRSGKHILYSLASGPIVEMIAAVQRMAEHNLAEAHHLIETYYRKLDALEPIASAELIARLRDDTVTLLDVRPDDEFRAGHLPGALQVDLAELELRLGELPPDREIVAYCRGPYCVLSFEAVSLLRAHGLPARRLVDGFPEWKAAGLPVEKAA
jgi:rhodanese-related sulfurtransferase/DNA-binding HxlR family transcriptional regulator